MKNYKGGKFMDFQTLLAIAIIGGVIFFVMKKRKDKNGKAGGSGGGGGGSISRYKNTQRK
jgi:LPXTG-motif cell wall-anchored protein|tara:strand:+ start:767 stop:946 length:180 start_codon:yes stop_codon:yes gene_type:complete